MDTFHTVLLRSQNFFQYCMNYETNEANELLTKDLPGIFFILFSFWMMENSFSKYFFVSFLG